MKELVNIQQSLHAPKAKRNNYGSGFSYRSAEDILEAAKEPLKANNCYLILTDDIEEKGGSVYMVSIATIYNEKGECCFSKGYAKEPQSLANMSAPQITGSISSYARKYALCGLFAIDGTDIKDEVDALPQAKESVKAKVSEEVSPYAKMIAEVYDCKSREEFVAYMRKYYSYLSIPEVKAACEQVSKKYPKTK